MAPLLFVLYIAVYLENLSSLQLKGLTLAPL